MDIKKLSDGEWPVMQALWQGGSMSLGGLVAVLHPQTGWSRNTVHTYLTRMETKGLVSIDRTQTPHTYRAGVSEGVCAAAERRGLLDRVYRGSAGKLVAAFLQEEKLTAQERDALRQLLDEMEV